MSEVAKKVTSAAQVVENSLAASVKDLESGIGSFFSGGHAHTHEAAPVREGNQEREQEPGTGTTAGQIIAEQQIGGKDYYVVETDSKEGKGELVRFEKNGTDYEPGQDVIVKWNDGKPVSAKAENGAELPWGGEIAGQSQFTDKSQFASQYHDENEKGI